MVEDNNNSLEKYLFFSSQDLIDYFMNNLRDKDIKTQCKREFEMARVLMSKKKFKFEELYSMVVMVRDIKQCAIIEDVMKLYFKEGKYPIGVFVEIPDLEEGADVEIEFSAFKGDRHILSTLKEDNYVYPFSQGIVIDNCLHTSGIGYPYDDIREASAENLRDRIRKCLANIDALIKSGGTSLDSVYSFIVYLKDINDLAMFEEEFALLNLNKENVQLEAVEVDNLYKNYDFEISCSASL